MTNYTITTYRNGEFTGNNYDVRSEAAMWNTLREIRNGLKPEDITAPNTFRALVETNDKDKPVTVFKDITFKMNAKGKIEMPNAVKETCRYTKVKAAKAAALAKAEAKKAAKREADRRYREKKKAAKAAAAAVETPSEETK